MHLVPRLSGYAFLALFVLSTVSGAQHWVVPLVCAAQAAVLVLAQRHGYRLWLLAAQVLLAYTPAVFDPLAPNLDCLLAATVLWCVPGRWRWPAFLVAAGLSEVAHGWPAGSEPGVSAVTTAAIGLVMYSFLRLPQLVDRLEATREDLARMTLDQERMRAASRIRAAMGDDLDAVAGLLRDARAKLPREQEHARAAVVEAGQAVRQMIETVRSTAATHGTDAPKPRDSEPVARLAPQLSLFALVASLATWISRQAIENPGYWLPISLGGTAMAVMLLVQLHWPRLAMPMLLGQTAVALLPLPWLGATWCTWLILLAAAYLLAQRGVWSVVAAVALVALRAGYTEESAQLERAGWVILAMQATLVLFGLARFWQLTVQMNRSRAELAELTVRAERARLSRDIHDLLGLSLSVLALKADLIAELVLRDPAKAAAQLDESLRIAAGATFEARAMVDDSTVASLNRELLSARTALAQQGIAVHIVSDDLPARPSAILVPVVREAVTNILRHSAATRVQIECRRREASLYLRISNDAARPSTRQSGQGLRNIRSRVAEAGGYLDTSTRDGDFVLEARIPLDAGAASADCTPPDVHSAPPARAPRTTSGNA
ncbi:sensor histidine kinase [Longispora albida]|uniref:sensor histidine kinase n=1 Tax=Longispora albida TaxID=203523 RepID=UPI000377EE8F|nr:histidine kinase [Longispora albida]